MSGGSKQRTSTVNNIDSSTKNQSGEINFAGDVGSGNTLNRVTNTTVTDNGAVNKALESSVLNTEKAFNFTTSALKFDSEKSARAFEFGNKSVDGAFSLSKSINDNLTKTNKDNLSFAENNAKDAYKFSSESASNSYKVIGDTVGGAFNLAKIFSDNTLKTNKDALSLAQNNARDSYNFVRTLKNPGVENDSQNFQALVKWGAISIAGIGLVLIFKGAK